MTIKITDLATVPHTGYATGPARLQDLRPSAYRLTRNQHGTLTLQGCYQWHQGINHGVEWRDIPTLDIGQAPSHG